MKKIEDIKVRFIKSEQLEKILGIEVPINHRLNISKECVFEDAFMINTDCNFSNINTWHHNEEIQKCLIFDCSFDAKTETGYKIGVNRFGKMISLTQFLLLASEMPLIEFIRFNYNPRIIGNQNLLMEHINELDNE